MKSFIKNLLIFSLLSYFVITIFKGIQMPANLLYYLLTIVVISVTVMISNPLLNFLTIQINFLTSFLTSSLLLMGIMYLLQMFMIDFNIVEYTFEGLSFGNVIVNSFAVDVFGTIILVSVAVSLLCSLFYELDKN